MGFLGYEVFISFKRNALDGSGKTRDYEIASDLHKALKDAGVEAFMSEKDLFTYDFRRKIDDALDESKIRCPPPINRIRGWFFDHFSSLV